MLKNCGKAVLVAGFIFSSSVVSMAADALSLESFARMAQAGKHRMDIRKGCEVHMQPGSSHLTVRVLGDYVKFVEYGSNTVEVKRIRLNPGDEIDIRARGGRWEFRSPEKLQELLGETPATPAAEAAKAEAEPAPAPEKAAAPAPKPVAKSSSSGLLEGKKGAAIVRNFRELQTISSRKLKEMNKDGGRLALLSRPMEVTDDMVVFCGSNTPQRTGTVLKTGSLVYVWFCDGGMNEPDEQTNEVAATASTPVPQGGEVVILNAPAAQATAATPSTPKLLSPEQNMLEGTNVGEVDARFRELFLKSVKK
jgi:hypothetical protein